MIGSINSTTPSFGHIDPSKMQEMRQQVFAEMDTDGSGAIDKAEFSAVARERAGAMQGAKSVDEIFAEIDTDGDGAITQIEMDAHAEAMKQKMQEMGPPPDMQNLSSFLSSEDDSESTSSLAALALQQYTGAYNATEETLLDLLG
ncbi:MAG: EF-hand domain-containing protein [candidate division Zixibacteria bacterium]|nr:EF-hand domain-containing protein [candidate division Zixibacteria bacterium]